MCVFNFVCARVCVCVCMCVCVCVLCLCLCLCVVFGRSIKSRNPGQWACLTLTLYDVTWCQLNQLFRSRCIPVQFKEICTILLMKLLFLQKIIRFSSSGTWKQQQICRNVYKICWKRWSKTAHIFGSRSQRC